MQTRSQRGFYKSQWVNKYYKYGTNNHNNAIISFHKDISKVLDKWRLEKKKLVISETAPYDNPYAGMITEDVLVGSSDSLNPQSCKVDMYIYLIGETRKKLCQQKQMSQAKDITSSTSFNLSF